MKEKTNLLIVAAALGFLILADAAIAQGTAFTYQGRLASGGTPANGNYDLTFALYATNTGGVAIAGPVTNAAVGVTNGLFTTTVDFGNVFTGASNWLQIAVSPSGSNAFVTLAPRQQLTPVPYAITADILSGTLPASQLTGTIASNQLGGVYPGTVNFTNGGNQFSGTFNGNGGMLSNLNSGALVLSTTNDVIVAWGANDYGQTTIPAGLGGVTAVAAGNVHSLALLVNGTVAAWGAGLSNNPTDGADYGQSIVPAGLSGVTAIAAGAFHSVALKNDGTVVAWGRDDFGQINVPGGLNNLQAISAGLYHTLALRGDGTVIAWGSNAFGVLNIPPGLNNVKMVSAGFVHSLALESNGTVVAWGAGMTNNPSDGIDFGQAIVPAGLSNVVAISAGGVHSLALKADGTVVAWGAGLTNNPGDGFNDYGQAIVPAGLSNVATVVAGLFHSLALRSNGTVVVWGGMTPSPIYLDNAQALAPGSSAGHVLALRPLSDAPVAWLDSDNTFNGNIQVNGLLNVAGGLGLGGDLRLNDATLWLRGSNDMNNGLKYGSLAGDGPTLFGQSSGALGTVGTNGSQVAVFWNNLQQVGIGTASPQGRLDLGGDGGNAKLLLQSGGGPSLGANAGQMFFNLGGAGRFSFRESPGGNELFAIVDEGSGFGAIGVGTVNPTARLDVRGSIVLGASGQYFAPGSKEDLYIIRGVVGSTGSIIAGTGFTVTKGATGFFTLNFAPAFSGVPSVVVTPQSGINRIATCTSVSTSSSGIWTRDTSGTATDNQFNFIAIGPK